MIAAIYARKITDQSGVADDQKSVARQVEHARAYATRKGWRVADEHVFVDDGICGRRIREPAGLLRLMNALKPRPPFEVLDHDRESRLGREPLETGYALKQLSQAGVRVFFYPRTASARSTPHGQVAVVGSALRRRNRAREGTSSAPTTRCSEGRAGHVTGGRVFGYDNVDLLDADGQRSHVERRIDEAEAAIVRRIFGLCAQGLG